ncbi:MAG: pilus assembly protein PilM [Betaproteobacteria bacterium]|nr:pilus assembly protein PilM [Betaproteobacteria bacterium]
MALIPKDAIVNGNVVSLEQVSDAVQLAWKLLGTRVAIP